MLKRILNIMKLFQKDKSKIQFPLNTLYGPKYLLYVINFALICTVLILSIISASIYFLMPVMDDSKLSRIADIQEDDTLPAIKSIDIDFSEEEKQRDENYTIISTKNVFSPQRKEWVVKAAKPKLVEKLKKKSRKKKSTRKPKKIILHGVVIAGDFKKALIKNPMTGVKNKKAVYVEEGQEIEGYMVTSIESDQIRLDWQGEEIIIKLYAGVGGVEQQKGKKKVPRVKPGKARIRDLHPMEDVTERREKNYNPLEDTYELASPELLMMEQESEPK